MTARSVPGVRYTLSTGRDRKKGQPIIVYGVLSDSQGRPLAVQVYPGNRGDGDVRRALSYVGRIAHNNGYT